MARILVIDVELLGMDFVLRCTDAGHDVRWFRDTPKKIKYGQGFHGFTIVDDWRSSMKWAKDGLIFLTGNCRFCKELDTYREFGFKIFGPTSRSAALEIDRQAGMDALQAIGVDLPPYEVFNSLEDAEAYCRKNPNGWVFKTLGSESDKSLSYVSSDAADMVGWIQQKIERGMKLKGPCMIQEKIDMVAELGVSGWFGPEGFLPGKWQIAFEHKKLMNGEIGPNTGESGTVCQYVETDKMAEEFLKPMEATLLKAGHRGDFAINCGIDNKGKAWPFEFTARAGWPAFFIQMASHKGDPAQWMLDLLNGKDSLKVSYDVAIGVVMGQPNYPYDNSKPEIVEGNPIRGIDEAGDAVHPVAVMIGNGYTQEGEKVVKAKVPMTAGEYVMVVTGLGRTVEKARKKVYSAVDEIKFANAVYRTDIGEKLEKSLPDLKKWGYCEELDYQ